MNQPTFDANLYSAATDRSKERISGAIESLFDKDGLIQWMDNQLQHAYAAGLRDGYVQGRHDRHNEEGA